MRIASWILAVLLTLAGVGGAWLAWSRWPPILQYRVSRIDGQTRLAVERYLKGDQPLESTARVLATLYDRKTVLSSCLPMSVPAAGTGALTAVTLAVPEGVSHDDPRLKELGDRISDLMVGPEDAER